MVLHFFSIFDTLRTINRLLTSFTVSNSNLITKGGICVKISYDIFKCKNKNFQELEIKPLLKILMLNSGTNIETNK